MKASSELEDVFILLEENNIDVNQLTREILSDPSYSDFWHFTMGLCLHSNQNNNENTITQNIILDHLVNKEHDYFISSVQRANRFAYVTIIESLVPGGSVSTELQEHIQIPELLSQEYWKNKFKESYIKNNIKFDDSPENDLDKISQLYVVKIQEALSRVYFITEETKYKKLLETTLDDSNERIKTKAKFLLSEKWKTRWIEFYSKKDNSNSETRKRDRDSIRQSALEKSN